MKQYEGYLIDLDGTVYAGKTKIPAAKRFIERLQKNKTPFLFATNNSTQLPKAVKHNLADNHDIYISESNVYTSGMATADYLVQQAKKHPDKPRTVYVVGEADLKQVIISAGFSIDIKNPTYTVVGLDSDLTYEKLVKAVLAIQAGSIFIGTNPDTNIPKERGHLPGAGAVVDFVRYATQVQPIIIGKPQATILNSAMAKMGIQPKKAIMVGDNYNTDIKAGINAGIDTLLVFGGVSTPASIKSELVQPTYMVDSLDDWNI